MPQNIWPAGLKVPNQSIWRFVNAIEREDECQDCRYQNEYCKEARAARTPLEFGGEAEEPTRSAVHEVALFWKECQKVMLG